MRAKQARTWLFVALLGILAFGARPASAQVAGEVLVYGIYDTREDAQLALNTLLQLRQQTNIPIRDYAAVYKDESGQLFILESPRRVEGGAVAGGAVIGGLIGLLGGPVGVLVGAGVGAGVGAVASADAIGISPAQISQIQAALQPGTAAVFVTTNQRFAPSVVSALEIEPQAFPQAPPEVQSVPVQPRQQIQQQPQPQPQPQYQQQCPPQMQMQPAPQRQYQQQLIQPQQQEYILEPVPQRQYQPQQEYILEPAPQRQYQPQQQLQQQQLQQQQQPPQLWRQQQPQRQQMLQQCPL